MVLKIIRRILISVFIVGVFLFFFHFNNLKTVDDTTIRYYHKLKELLVENGYSDKLVVISTNRSKFENYIFGKISLASPKSQHFKGKAIDFIVLDINKDRRINSEDVKIVYQILDKQIIQDEGGIGTYTKKGLLSRQMVHIDCRGTKSRWRY